MAQWTHQICDFCWLARCPDRDPVRLIDPVWEVCCFCGCETKSGIYVVEDPTIPQHCEATQTR